MSVAVSMTNNWQIHIPDAIRKAMNINKPGQFIASVEKDAIVLRQKPSSFNEYFGAFRTRKKINVENLRANVDYSDL